MRNSESTCPEAGYVHLQTHRLDCECQRTFTPKDTDHGKDSDCWGHFTLKPVDARNRGQEAARALWRSFIGNLTSWRKQQSSLGLIRFGPVGAASASLLHFFRFQWRHFWRRRKRRQRSSAGQQRHTPTGRERARACHTDTENSQSTLWPVKRLWFQPIT